MVSFSQLPSVKEDTIFGAARKFFGPSYFVTALVTNPIIDLSYKCLACEPFLFVIEHLFTSKFESRYLYSWNPQSALNYLTCFCLDLMTIFHSFFFQNKKEKLEDILRENENVTLHANHYLLTGAREKLIQVIMAIR